MSTAALAPTPAPAALKPAELAKIRQTPDGNLIVNLARYGRLTVELPNSGHYLEICVTRAKGGDRPFQTYVSTGVAGSSEVLLDAKRANHGHEPRATHYLTLNGELRLLEDELITRKERHAATGHAAAAADPDTTAQPTAHEEPSQPASEQAADDHGTAAGDEQQAESADANQPTL